jgi:hypothetical protein
VKQGVKLRRRIESDTGFEVVLIEAGVVSGLFLFVQGGFPQII